MEAVKLRRMRIDPGEVDRVDRLLMTAYNAPSRRRELGLYLSAQPDGWFVIADGDDVIAVAGAVSYGTFCWVGLVATDPGYRRQKLATRLSAHLVGWARERGCATVALDASETGRPVYERLGFQAAGFTVELQLPDAMPAGRSPARVSPSVRGMEELAGLDRRVFGGDRTALLRALRGDSSYRCYSLPAHGRLAGYLFASDRMLGPGCACDDTAAVELVTAAVRGAQGGGAGCRILVPVESGYLAALLGLGSRERRRLAHMRLGDLALPGERHRLIAQTSYAAG